MLTDELSRGEFHFFTLPGRMMHLPLSMLWRMVKCTVRKKNRIEGTAQGKRNDQRTRKKK